MGMHTITLKNGAKYAANEQREGVFYRRPDGTWSQMAGTGDTPKFKTPSQLRSYIRKHFCEGDMDGGKLPHLNLYSSNWP